MALLTTRRSQWLPGVAVLGAAVGIGTVLGLSAGMRAWPFYLGLILATLLLIGWLERLLAHRRSLRPVPRARGKLKVIPGGKSASYDLAKDDSTDNQRYLM